jgi:hypothetical protein
MGMPSFHGENGHTSSLNWNRPLFGNKSSSLQKLLAKANKTTERATKFLNKIKSRQLACANRAKSIPENATIRKEYIKCGKEVCPHKHQPSGILSQKRFYHLLSVLFAIMLFKFIQGIKSAATFFTSILITHC